MLRSFENNGIRFVPVNALGESISLDFDELFYSEQLVVNEWQLPNCSGCEIVDFSDISRFAFLSDAAVTLSVFDSTNTTLATGISASDSWALNGDTVYFFELNFAAIVGVGNGSYIRVTNSTDFLQSEALKEPANAKPIKLTYSNEGDHFTLGSFQKCKDFIAYHCAKVHNPLISQNRTVYEQANAKFKQTTQSAKRTREIELFGGAPYKSEAFAYQISSDEVFLTQKIGSKTTTNKVRLFEDSTVEINAISDRHHATNAKARITFDGSEKIRITSLNFAGATPPTINEETNITSTSFTANWSGSSDSYNLQVSTTSDFSSLILDVTGILGTTYNITGLTSCVKYYYRIQGFSCAGLTDWVVNENRHTISCHLRGDYKAQSLQFDEKITDLIVTNVFAMATGLQFRYASGIAEPADWALFPFLDLAGLQTEIDAGGSDYWIQVSISDFTTTKRDAVIIFEYTSATFYLTVGCLTVNLPSGGEASKDILIGMRSDRKFDLQSITFPPEALSIRYALRTSATGNYTDFPFTGFAGINAEIAAFSTVTTDLLVHLQLTYSTTGSFSHTIFVNYL